MMPDREKIIKGLELCITDMNRSDSMPCRSCPYGSLPKRENCQKRLFTDALAMLKEQKEKPLRCEKCSYHREDGWCSEHKQYVKETDYCSLGAWKGR